MQSRETFTTECSGSRLKPKSGRAHRSNRETVPTGKSG
jgi:hypothetical protein